jgi:hypothetical protein
LPTTLLDRIKERAEPSKVTQLVLVKVPPWVKRRNEGMLKAKVLYNGSWTPADEGGAA